MKKIITIAAIAIVASTILTGCASVKDKQGNVVGKCYGLSCAVRGAFDYNHIDTETGLLEGTYRIGSISLKPKAAADTSKAPASPASAPVESKVLGEAAAQQTPQM